VIALGGVVRLTETVAFSVGRTVVTEILDGDLTASFQVPPGGGQFPAGTTKPTLAALVEFDD
jgi:hypothetical protein